MSTISRRSALLGGAAGLATAATTIPLAVKATAVKEALAGNDAAIYRAFEAFEAARSDYKAIHVRIDEAYRRAKAQLPPEPDFGGRYDSELTKAEKAELMAWRRRFRETVDRRLDGIDEGCPPEYRRSILEDRPLDFHYARACAAHKRLALIRPRTIDGLLRQIEAYYRMEADLCADGQLPECSEEELDSLEAQDMVLRIYHDLKAIAGRAQS